MSKMCYFLFSSKHHFLGKTLPNICFLHDSARFVYVFLAILKFCLNDVEIWFFFFNGHFLVIVGFKISFDVFAVFKIS